MNDLKVIFSIDIPEFTVDVDYKMTFQNKKGRFYLAVNWLKDGSKRKIKIKSISCKIKKDGSVVKFSIGRLRNLEVLNEDYILI